MSGLGFSLREKLPDRADEGENKNIHKCILCFKTIYLLLSFSNLQSNKRNT
jgi:hypothetical protein